MRVIGMISATILTGSVFRSPGVYRSRASVVARPAVGETWDRSLVWKDPLEEGMATHSSILAWRIPWTGAWRATVEGVAKSGTQLSLCAHRGASSQQHFSAMRSLSSSRSGSRGQMSVSHHPNKISLFKVS